MPVRIALPQSGCGSPPRAPQPATATQSSMSRRGWALPEVTAQEYRPVQTSRRVAHDAVLAARPRDNSCTVFVRPAPTERASTRTMSGRCSMTQRISVFESGPVGTRRQPAPAAVQSRRRRLAYLSRATSAYSVPDATSTARAPPRPPSACPRHSPDTPPLAYALR